MTRFFCLALVTVFGLGFISHSAVAQSNGSQTLSAPNDPFAYKPYDPTQVSPEDRAAQEKETYILDDGGIAVNPSLPTTSLPADLGIGSLQTKDVDESAVPPEEIPDVLLDEMNIIVSNCKANYVYNNFHDCECLGVKFIDARLKSSPDISKETTFEQIGNECASEEKIAGYVFQSCMSFMKDVRPDDFKEYCECTANTVAEKYIKEPFLNVGYIENLRRQSYYSCGERARERLVDKLNQ